MQPNTVRNLALAVILDPPETLAIHAESGRQNISLALLLDDHLLEMRHDRLAVLDRKPNLTGRQAMQYPCRSSTPNDGSSRTRPSPSNTIFHCIGALQDESHSLQTIS